MDIILCSPSPRPQFPSLLTLVSPSNPKKKERPQKKELVKEKDCKRGKDRTREGDLERERDNERAYLTQHMKGDKRSKKGREGAREMKRWEVSLTGSQPKLPS